MLPSFPSSSKPSRERATTMVAPRSFVWWRVVPSRCFDCNPSRPGVSISCGCGKQVVGYVLQCSEARSGERNESTSSDLVVLLSG